MSAAPDTPGGSAEHTGAPDDTTPTATTPPLIGSSSAGDGSMTDRASGAGVAVLRQDTGAPEETGAASPAPPVSLSALLGGQIDGGTACSADGTCD